MVNIHPEHKTPCFFTRDSSGNAIVDFSVVKCIQRLRKQYKKPQILIGTMISDICKRDDTIQGQLSFGNVNNA